ncbi:hypothetical protein [Fulvivirga ligni]|uniref:hypothetical protein n=1 Tax=Fulvivirga ligni TaxID=2904246 RepID=UPI001F3C86F5|nr:hypothetical protein [Fulvivirga ligni]UII22873.1 hypothetical protein LVD16_06510 [Fulvivirga ligni]
MKPKHFILCMAILAGGFCFTSCADESENITPNKLQEEETTTSSTSNAVDDSDSGTVGAGGQGSDGMD